MNWYSGLEDICQPDAPLAEYTWYGLGGPARWLVRPRGENELATVLHRCNEHQIPWRILGRGANILIRDEGFDGVVIQLSAPHWEHIHFDTPLVHAGAGVDFTRLVRQSVEHGLAGLENLAGIPGSVGGIIRMNAGGRYGSISHYVREVRVMTPGGSIRTAAAAELEFRYRHSNLGGGVVIAATFALAHADREPLIERFRTIWQEKAGDQPAMSARSAGCIFKNPPDRAAGKLIDDAGLKGHRVGQAEISTRHANFILAYPGAKTHDVLELITYAKDCVRNKTGIELELEVEVW